MSKGFERKVNSDGTPNSKYVDLLDEDKPLAGQKYCCISFVSPENILKQREQFYFQEFLKQWDLSKSVEKFHQFLNFVSYKYELEFDSVMNDLQEFIKEENKKLQENSVSDDFKTFLDKNQENLDKTFNIENSVMKKSKIKKKKKKKKGKKNKNK